MTTPTYLDKLNADWNRMIAEINEITADFNRMTRESDELIGKYVEKRSDPHREDRNPAYRSRG